MPPDWFDDEMENLDQDDELNQSAENSSSDTRRNKVFAYMFEARMCGQSFVMMITAWPKLRDDDDSLKARQAH